MSLEVQQIEPGFWRWTVPHPEWTPEKGKPGGWGEQVGCAYHEGPDALVLIDPLAPAAGTPERERFWQALDADVERVDLPVAVILANRYHVRSAREVRERYERRRGATVWAHEETRPHLAAGIVTNHFRDRETLPGAVHARVVSALTPDETVLWIPSRSALVVADAILGAGNGELRLAPPSWAAQGTEARALYDRDFRSQIHALLDLPCERVLVAHGDAVLEGGCEALARALESPLWGS